MTVRINPYQRLLKDVKDFAWKVKYASRKIMWTYPKARLSEGWSLADLHARVSAADQLGYDVHLIANDEGLVVKYVKRADIPFGWAL